MKILGNEIKPGMIIEHRNDLWSVLKAQHVKPGKGGAFNQVELKSVKKGTKLNERFRSSDSVERAVLDEKKFNFLYEDENNCHFMDQTNFEQIAINKSLLGEKNKLLKENMAVNVHFYEDQALSVDLPSSVELTITNTDATIKGQTASSSYKPATLENGINIMVPPFINSGDKIILDTSTLEYIKKLNK
jgi:elongation factor P